MAGKGDKMAKHESNLSVTMWDDGMNLPTNVVVFKQPKSGISLGIRCYDGKVSFDVRLTDDQAMWLASALAEATSEQTEVTP